jgi:hypothetical protein
MPIPPPVKAVLRKDLLLGGAAGTALCAALVGAAITIGPLLGIDFGGGTTAGAGASEAANLPALPRVANPSAEALRAQTRAPRIVDTAAQPTTRVAPRPAAGRAPAATSAPSIVGRRPQTTSAAPVKPRSNPTGPADAAVVPAPEPAAPVAAAAAAIPVTPALPVRVATKMTLRVASVAVEPDDNGSPQLRLSLAIDRPAATAAAAPEAVTVTLRPQLPSHAAAAGPLSLRAIVDVVDAPADNSSSEGGAAVPGLQMRVRMALSPADSTAATAPTVADTGDGDGQSNVISVDVPLVAFADPDHPSKPAEPTVPGAPAATPAPPTEIRLDLAPAADTDAHPATETATVTAPDAPAAEHAPADVPVTVVVDSAPDPAPAPPADPAPAPQPAPDPAPAPPADTTPASPPPAYPDGQATDAAPTVTAEATTPAPDPAATAPDAPADGSDAPSSSGS